MMTVGGQDSPCSQLAWLSAVLIRSRRRRRCGVPGHRAGVLLLVYGDRGPRTEIDAVAIGQRNQVPGR